MSAEHDLYIKDTSTLNVTNSYEGVEAAHIYFEGGTSTISASDDGINAATDYSTSDYSNLTIVNNGGYLSVNAQGDGIDSNGSIYFNGGTTLVVGPTSGANQAIDADSKIYYNGGLVFAVGASGMSSTSNFTSTTSNYVVDLTSSSSSSQVSIVIKDSSGNVIFQTTVYQSFGELIFSSSSLSKGTYTFTIGSSSTTITISSTVTSSGSRGGQGGGFNPGRP